jgi:hypothetical protein
MRRSLVVFSMDLTITRSLGVMGELASFKGLKFNIAFKILFAIGGRERMSMEREFNVASTSTASLGGQFYHGEEYDRALTSYSHEVLLAFYQEALKLLLLDSWVG